MSSLLPRFGGRDAALVALQRACAGRHQWNSDPQESSHAAHYTTAAFIDPSNLGTGTCMQPQLHNPLDHTSVSISHQQQQHEQRQQLSWRQEAVEQPSLAGSAAAISGQTDTRTTAVDPAGGLLGRMQQAAAEGRHAAVVSCFAAEQLGEGQPRATQQAMFELALRACAAAGDVRRAFQLVAVMWKRSGMEVSHSAHFSVLRALCNAGELQRAVRYLSDIPSRRMQILHCNVVLHGAVSRGQVQPAQQVERLMQRRRVPLDAIAYSALIELRGLEGDATAVVAACEQALGACGAEAQPRLLAAKIIGLARAGALEEAIKAAEHMMDSLSASLPVDISGGIPQEQQEHHGRTTEAAAAATECNLKHAPRVSGRGGGSGMLADRQQRQQQQSSPLEYLRGACNAVLAQAEAAGDPGAAKHMTGLMTLRGLPPSTTTYNLLLRSAAKRAHDPMAAVQAVEEGMQEMQALGVAPNAETYELLLDAQGAAGNVEAMRRSLAAAVAAGLRLSPAGWSGVMGHFGACGDLEGVGEAYSELRQSGAWLTEGIFKAAFDAISAWGEAEVTQRALDDGPASSLVNRRIYQRQLAALLLDRWVGDMEALGIVHSPASFISLLQAYSYSMQPELVGQLMQRAFGSCHIASSSSSSPTHHHQQHEAHQQQQQQEEEEVKAQQQQQQRHSPPTQQAAAEGGQGVGPFARSVIPGRIRPDPRIFTAAIGACCRLGRLQEAVDMLRLMRKSGLEPAIQTYTSLIALCAYKRMPGLARSMVADMRERGLEPTLHTYNALLKVECHCGGGLDAALQLIQDMQHRGISPDEVSWRTVLSAAKFVGRSDVAELARKRLSGGPSGVAEPLSWDSPEQAEEPHQPFSQYGEPRQQAQQHQQPAQQGQQEGWQNYYTSNVGFDEDEEEEHGEQEGYTAEAGMEGGSSAKSDGAEGGVRRVDEPLGQ